MVATLEPSVRAARLTSPIRSKEVRLDTQARWALDHSPYRALSLLDCEVSDGTIVVSGLVPSYYLKQLAQELLLRLDCGCRIENRVEVCPL